MHAPTSDIRDAGGTPLVWIFAAGVASGMLFVLALHFPDQTRQVLLALLLVSRALGRSIVGTPLVLAGVVFPALLACGLVPVFRHDRESH